MELRQEVDMVLTKEVGRNQVHIRSGRVAIIIWNTIQNLSHDLKPWRQILMSKHV